MSEVVVWTDFERVNRTHFWSQQKQVYLQPGTRPEDGNRKALIFNYDGEFDLLHSLCSIDIHNFTRTEFFTRVPL